MRLRIHGDSRDFPFDNPAKGQFQVTARVQRGVLLRRGALHGNTARDLNFERDRWRSRASGSILGTKLSNVRVAIPSLRGPEHRVHVSGQADVRARNSWGSYNPRRCA